ncbi:MAG: hypothetical protein EPN62_19805 [Candidimonas sp.]|nr:MAG: hypothetical protein EPN62_19805 [Candidimonas sp.]
MFTDPQVVRRKVERELAVFVDRIDHYRARGIWVLEYRFPELLVAFVASKFKPYPIAPYGVLMDLSNYDVEPPSVKFVNPFTREPLMKKEIPTELKRLRVLPAPQQPTAPEHVGNPQAANVQPMGPQLQEDRLLQWWTDDDYPFICLQGIREYHENPAHTGDPWWLYRGKGAGGIIRLLELISKYGTEPMTQLNFQLQFIPAGIVQQQVMDPP